jgi:hypothetical protein
VDLLVDLVEAARGQGAGLGFDLGDELRRASSAVS